MAVVRMNLGPDWDAHLNAGIEKLFATRLGPAILDDQQRGVPVLTGDLLASLDDRIVQDDRGRPELRVGSFPTADHPDGIPYVLAVEFGFHGPEMVRAHLRNGRPVRAHMRMGNSPQQAFMRPSAYRRRSP